VEAIQLPMATTHIGYKHGQRNSRGELHPGYDLNYGTTPNADLGRPVVAPVALKVADVGARKYYGNYVVGVNEALGYVFRFLHLDQVHCTEGQTLAAGKLLGTCGHSHYGGWPGMSAHLHYDILRLSVLKARKLPWLYWPNAQTSPEDFATIFVNPASLHPQLLLCTTVPGAVRT
jgi:murein DD-endopeptidase MepM/ murein hydrolase activator NlpD